MEQKKVTNTTERVREDVSDGNFGALVHHTMPGSIERSEKRGQEELVKSTLLPTSFGLSSDEETARDRALMEGWGFKFGEPVEGDPLFMNVELPEGWTRSTTDHDMHSNVLDEKGRERINVFYKAAFYDRRADMRLCGRYRIDFENVSEGKTYSEDICKQTVIDTQTDEVLKVFTGNLGDSDDAARAFLQEKIGDGHNASLWDD